MFCSECGNKNERGLNYCNSCGRKLFDVELEHRKQGSNSIFTPVSLVALGGLISFIVLVRLLLKENVIEGVVITILLAFLATVFGICYMLIKQTSADAKSGESVRKSVSTMPKQMKPASTNQLEEPKQQPASVIENTTRTLDGVKVERKQ